MYVWLDDGTGRTELVSDEKYNDGYFHTVTVSKQNRE